MENKRNVALDAIKGLAIIAVCLYHFGGGYLPYGYLGVDIFLVVGGYLLIRSISKKIENNSFHYWSFLFRKVIRLWPLIVLAIIVSMLMGYVLMLPDDYENLAESAIASSLFANNILQCITTKNYWDVVNRYKPLMHLWYVGVLMQAYIILPLIYLMANKVIKKDANRICSIVLTVVSFFLFLLPFFSTAQKFYYLPFRVFEITAGGILLFLKPIKKHCNIIAWTSLLALLILLCSRWLFFSESFMLVATVIATLVFIYASINLKNDFVWNALSVIGKRSYSIYIWHQVIISFLFYSLFQYAGINSFLIFILLTTIISVISYQYVEIPLGKMVSDKKRETTVIVATLMVSVLACTFSGIIYLHSGVVRDVPELNITKDSFHRNMHSEYCDRPYSWDYEFADNSEPKILVLGNSFGRDWANILYEYDENLNISYKFYTDESLNKIQDRIDSADFVFFAVHGESGVPNAVLEYIPSDKLYVVGNKNFGESNGIIYANRNKADYFQQRVIIPDKIIQEDVNLSEQFADHYISLIAPISNGNTIRVFTDDNMFISQDCRHLTQAGARYYTEILDIKKLLDMRN